MSDDTETLAEVRLTDAERQEMAEGWPDFWKVHAAVERILAARIVQARADAEMDAQADWLHRYAELNQKYLIATCPWCTCEEGPYFGAQMAGTPLRCERCGHDESEQARAGEGVCPFCIGPKTCRIHDKDRAGEGALRERMQALDEKFKQQSDQASKRELSDPNAYARRATWDRARELLRAALAETDRP